MRAAAYILALSCSYALAQRQGGGDARLAEPTGRLPDSPGFVSASSPTLLQQHGKESSAVQVPCQASTQMPVSTPEAVSAEEVRTPCMAAQDPYRRFLDSTLPSPLSPRQKGLLALHDIIDPFNLLTIGGNAAFTVGINSHTAYGPGLGGFGRLVGYSFVEDATGESIGTFGVCTLLHQDPRYHRDPQASTARRVLHAVQHTILSQHDDGTPMPNYEVLITYPASAEISNLYVPGIHGNGLSTVERILTGLATDPVNNLITEFLPDFARRVHIRVVFVQQILNNIAASGEL